MTVLLVLTLIASQLTHRQTIMSTSIVQYQIDDNGISQKLFQDKALRFFMTLTIPITLVIFAIWAFALWADYYMAEKWPRRSERPQV